MIGEEFSDGFVDILLRGRRSRTQGRLRNWRGTGMRSPIHPVILLLMSFGLIIAVSGIRFYYERNDKIDRARADLNTLTLAVRTYKLKSGANPQSLNDVLQYIAGGDPWNLVDPWGRRYDYDPNGPRNGGKWPDIWTVSPSGELLG